MRTLNEAVLKKLGFRFGKSSTHLRRTIMLEDLELLLEAIPKATDVKEYITAIEDQNCLRKRTEITRKYSGQYLTQMYTLNPKVAIFRSLLYFWNRELEARALLALLCSVARDDLLRKSIKVILDKPESAALSRGEMEEFIDSLEPGRYSKVTLASIAKNLNSSWTKSGHLTGRAKKIRSRAQATPAAVAYALYLSYLNGARGTELFETDYLKVMDCSRDRAIELAEIASMRGWMVFKRIGNVVEALFPILITEEEANWLRE